MTTHGARMDKIYISHFAVVTPQKTSSTVDAKKSEVMATF
jgi:hypothetical protein